MILNLLYISLVSGVLAGIPLPISGVTVYLSDIAAICCLLYCFIHVKSTWQLCRTDHIIQLMGGLLGILLLSLIFSPVSLTLTERLISSLYLIRYAVYFAIYIYIRLQQKYESIHIHVLWSIVAIACIGWIQYLLYPDLRNLYYLGWDPHDRRMFSTYLDPNYLGLIFVIGLILTTYSRIKDSYRILVGVFLLTSLAFTYSRSSYLAFVIAMIAVGINTKKYLLLGIVTVALAVLIIVLPRPEGESANLLRLFTITGRVQNIHEATQLIARYPISGVGFNTLRYAKHEMGFSTDDWETNHAEAGFDNSFVFVAATSGLIGLALYIIVLLKAFFHISLMGKTVLLAIFTHALIVNSLFFPWVLICLWVVVGITKSN